MVFIEYDYVIKQIATAGPDKAFCDSVLPWTLKSGSLGFHSEAFDCFSNFSVKVRATVENEVARSAFVRKCLAQLLNHLCTRRMPGHVAIKNLTSPVDDNEETIKHAKGYRWHSEKIHRSNHIAVIGKKCGPSLRRLGAPGRLAHPVLYSSLRDGKVEHLQLAINPWRPPRRVLSDHSKDQLTQFLARWLPAEGPALPGDPFPIHFESRTMPTNNSFGLHDEKRPLPSRPESAYSNPEKFVR